MARSTSFPRRTFLRLGLLPLLSPFGPRPGRTPSAATPSSAIPSSAIPSSATPVPPPLPEAPPLPRYHLLARPWQPLDTPPEAYLDVIEGLCRFTTQHQNEAGAVIDPFLGREHQYATPYFAYAVGTLVHTGHASDLLGAGARAMDHATAAVERGHDGIPDGHGEFFLAPLAGALALYAPYVSADMVERWRTRLSASMETVIEDLGAKTNNWRTYAMKGEWLRHRAGLVERDVAVDFIVDAWTNRTQRERIVPDAWNLYQDWNGHPQSHAVEAVGRGNLLALVAAGYDGPHAAEIRTAVERGTETSLLLQDPTGQCPPNGRTDDHVFNDVLYQLAFEVMAEGAAVQNDPERAGQYRRAALLAFHSIARWRRDDPPWEGSFFITKNHFDPGERVGYQPASQYGNYSGAVMYHLAEAYHARLTPVDEAPAPTEIGGYTLAMDPRFGSAVANAGGMQVFANLLGDTVPKYDTYWTPLGVVRFARAGWDSRLGPSDGAHDHGRRQAVTFGPEWRRMRRWVRLAEMSEHYQGTLYAELVHPMLVRCRLLYAPVTGVGGPNFFLDLTLTPDGVLATLHSPHEVEFGLTLPLLENDGRALDVRIDGSIARTAYPPELGDGDEQCFLVLNDTPNLETGRAAQSTYGWLRHVRVTADADRIEAFVYPRNATDPTAEDVLEGFERTPDGFASPLGRVDGARYIGRTAAGGVSDSLSLRTDTAPEVTFDSTCGFMVLHADDTVTAIEADRDVTAIVQGQVLQLEAFVPRFI